MAVEYSISAETSASLAEIENVLCERCGLSAFEDGKTRLARMIVGVDVVCYLMPEDDLGSKLIVEHFAFRPNVQVRVRLDKLLIDSAANMLIEIIAVLLECFECDLVVLENDESPLVLRKSGDVIINDKDQYWVTKFQRSFLTRGIDSKVAPLPGI